MIDRQIESILDYVAVPEQTISDFKEYVKSSKQAELEYKKAEIERIEAKINKIDQRMTSLFNMRLDQELTKDEYEIKRDGYKLEKYRLELLKNSHQIADDGFNETVLNMFDLLSSAKSIFKSSTDIKNKQLLLHFIFEKLELKEGVIRYKLKSPFCYTKENSSVSTLSPVSVQNAEFCELKENQGFEGDFSPNLSPSKNGLCEPQILLKNQEVRPENLTSVQFGCFTWIRTKINGVRVRCPTIRRWSNLSNKGIFMPF